MSSDPYAPPKSEVLFQGNQAPNSLPKRATRWLAVPLNVLLVALLLLSSFGGKWPHNLADYLLAGIVLFICLISLASLLVTYSMVWIRSTAVAVNILAGGWLASFFYVSGPRNPWFLSAVILVGSTFVMNVVAMLINERTR